MGNALRTDYITDIGKSYDPYRSKRNALAIQGAEANIQGAEADIGRKRAFTESIGLENVLRQQAIDRAPFQNEMDAADFYMKTRHLATPETWGAYRQIFIDKGVDPSMIPEKWDPDYMKESDTEFEKFLADQKRKDEANRLDAIRKDKKAKQQATRDQEKFDREEKRKDTAFTASQNRAQEKFDFEQKQLKNKTDDTSEKDKANSARQFIQSLSKSTDDTFGLMIAAIATGGSLDPTLIAQGESEIPEKLKPAYNQAIRILEKYYGVPAIQSEVQDLEYDPARGLIPIPGGPARPSRGVTRRTLDPAESIF